ncbi:unnamed protein product [Mycena citricolor]|uniref:Telomere-associated protein Rif1 N-terminal domain-containing protein n=1 Tax=Mycena citricolor TaxID=2018698 RepID=A0AAD2HZH6_9AGAR|nr:unnamed protein product [Mycena citricolor]
MKKIPYESVKDSQLVFSTSPPASSPSAVTSSDALQFSTYLTSPIYTLLDSLKSDTNVSVLDRTEAYNVISQRIRAHIRRIVHAAPEELPPALAELQDVSTGLSDVMKRDLSQLCDDPSVHVRRVPEDIYASSIHTDVEVDEEVARIARDFTLLVDYSLRLIADIFVFPALYSVFSNDSLNALLNGLLALGSARRSFSSSSCRHWTMVVWILSIQNLPTGVISPAKHQIVTVLKRALEGEIGTESAILDGLKACTRLLKQHPAVFTAPLSSIFPSVLHCLISDLCDVRLHANHALGAFALARINGAISNAEITGFSSLLSEFIEIGMLKSAGVPDSGRILSLISASLSASEWTHPAEGPCWVMQLIASVIILMDDAYFSDPRALKLTLQSLYVTFQHKEEWVSALHPCVWRCIIWIFSRFKAVGKDKASALRTVKQDLRGGLGLALVLTLLTSQEAFGGLDPIAESLIVLKDLMSDRSRHLQLDGIGLLTQLLWPSDASSTGGSVELLVPQLFDGSLLQASQSHAKNVVAALPRLELSQLRRLSDAEILLHWESIAKRWTHAMNICLDPKLAQLKLHQPYLSLEEYRRDLLHGWQSLLLAPSDSTEESLNRGTDEIYFKRFADVICSFIVATEFTGLQLQRLQTVDKMWQAMTNTFQRDRLLSSGRVVLEAAFQLRWDPSPSQDAWVVLCSRLIRFGVPERVEIMQEHFATGGIPLQIQKQLWTVAASSIQDTSPASDTIQLLRMSFGAWEPDMDIWNDLLSASFMLSAPLSKTEVVERILVKEHRHAETMIPLLTLFSHVVFSDLDHLPEQIVRILRTTLRDLYPDMALHPTSLLLVQRVKDLFLAVPLALALPLLLELEPSICTWLEDEEHLLTEDIRIDVAECLFAAPLSRLHHMEPSTDHLVTLSRFLSTLADADAFEVFWRKTYDKRRDLFHLVPETIQTCLKAYRDVFAGSLAGSVTDSQMDSLRTPQSQLTASSLDYGPDEGKGVSEETLHRPQCVVDRKDRSMALSIMRTGSSTPRPSTALDHLQEYSSWSEMNQNSPHIQSGRGYPTSWADSSMDIVESSVLAERPSPKHDLEQRELPSAKRRKTRSGPSGSHTFSVSASERSGGGDREGPDASLRTPPSKRSRFEQQQMSNSLPTPSPSLRSRVAASSDLDEEQEEEDYKSWENGRVAAEEVEQVDELNLEIPETSQPDVNADRSVLRRAQTVQQLLPQSPAPLQQATTSARLLALQQAYAVVEEDTSQPQLDVLLQASHLLHQIGAKLNEQIGRRARQT